MYSDIKAPFNKYFDHTLLKPDAKREDILKLAEEAVRYDFAAVCVNGCNVALAYDALKRACSDTGQVSSGEIKIAAVVGFPLGASTTQVKETETRSAIDDGASEIDMVINIGAAKDGLWEYVGDEIQSLANICHDKNAILKVIIETCLLTDEEIVVACESARDAGADFVKTSTGFSTGGATPGHVALMKKAAGPTVGVKASGGIRTLSDAKAMIDAGATRLGSSSSTQIMDEYSKSI